MATRVNPSALGLIHGFAVSGRLVVVVLKFSVAPFERERHRIRRPADSCQAGPRALRIDLCYNVAPAMPRRVIECLFSFCLCRSVRYISERFVAYLSFSVCIFAAAIRLDGSCMAPTDLLVQFRVSGRDQHFTTPLIQRLCSVRLPGLAWSDPICLFRTNLFSTCTTVARQ